MVSPQYSDKKEIIETFEEVSEKHFILAKLETLYRMRQNLIKKIIEIDTKIADIKRDEKIDFDIEIHP
ncbi:MAG: hypothetical protein ACTSWN_04345 [Promethearchaeota archaeon]